MDIVKQKGMTTRDIVKLKVEKEFESQREKILKRRVGRPAGPSHTSIFS